MLMRGKLEIFLFEGKLEIKSPGENKRNRGNHGITQLKHNNILQHGSTTAKLRKSSDRFKTVFKWIINRLYPGYLNEIVGYKRCLFFVANIIVILLHLGAVYMVGGTGCLPGRDGKGRDGKGRDGKGRFSSRVYMRMFLPGTISPVGHFANSA